MRDQFQTIREFVDRVPHKASCALSHHANNFCDCGKQETLNTLIQLGAMVKPVARYNWHTAKLEWLVPYKAEFNMKPMYFAAPVAQQYEAGDVASAAAQGFRDGVASVAQQPQARPDFTDEWTGYLKDGETPFERFLRERKDVQSVLKLYQRALEENERLKAQQPQAECWACNGTHIITTSSNGSGLFDMACPNCAQQPQADTPQATTIAEAARDVGKWLNERPNRPIDLRHVAMLVAHAMRPQAEHDLDVVWKLHGPDN